MVILLSIKNIYSMFLFNVFYLLPAPIVHVANQNNEIQKVQEEIQNLQKQILDRDTKICTVADIKQEEGR